MDALVSGLAIAALSGITYVAYKHPAAFNRLFLPILAGSCAFFLGVLLWDGSSDVTLVAVAQFIPQADFAAARAAAGRYHFLDPSYFLVIYFGFVAYMMFLGNLPRLLKEKHEP